MNSYEELTDPNIFPEGQWVDIMLAWDDTTSSDSWGNGKVWVAGRPINSKGHGTFKGNNNGYYDAYDEFGYWADESWYIVRNTRGVTSFVGPGSKPVALTEQEVASLGMEKLEIKLSYQVGDSVKVIDGPLEGFIGVVDEIDLTNHTVKVTVSMFGRGTPAELKFGQVAALEK